jgi:hypothetical protein
VQWKNATAEAVRVALLRQRCHAITAGQPPHQHAGDEAREVARPLACTLDLLTILRGGRRPEEVKAPEQRAAALEAKLLATTAAGGV